MRIWPLLLLAGCSYAFVHGPQHRSAHEECTELPIAPLLDTAGALGGLFFTGAIPAAAAGGDNGTLDGAVFATGVAVVIAAAFIASAAHGYRATARCRDLHSRTDEELAAEERAAKERAAMHESVEHHDAPPMKLEDRLAELHDQARAAARVGQCGIVGYIVARIRGLDAAYFASTVQPDPDLQACLTPTGP